MQVVRDLDNELNQAKDRVVENITYVANKAKDAVDKLKDLATNIDSKSTPAQRLDLNGDKLLAEIGITRKSWTAPVMAVGGRVSGSNIVNVSAAVMAPDWTAPVVESRLRSFLLSVSSNNVSATAFGSSYLSNFGAAYPLQPRSAAVYATTVAADTAEQQLPLSPPLKLSPLVASPPPTP
ncbi:hypothetical protein HXX76_010896 [Chlamydomonas incerta]|uniref:Uncharacterized protein n=1 Tax=Chlamydomonas incerta TaxID=51695 RepID=A0A835SH85_CHLIN|nr:hypothetical protein HXX76_010896 [Chlamydomonas incerta]|eukprot:KAG2427177.1 hypothetical protein HXX76_010896 [Chlamydomonas incerta]